MELRQLKYFIGVAEYGSFSAAAAALHIAQPALSRSIRYLEEELGTNLFTRHGKGVYLTDAGQRFQARAVAILKQIEQSMLEVRHEVEEPVGHITVGVPPSLEKLVAAPALSNFRYKYQNVLLHVIEGVSDMLRDQILCGNADLAIITSTEIPRNLSILPFVTEALYVIGPESGNITNDKAIPAADLLGLPLIVATQPNSSRSTIERYFNSVNKQPNIIMDATSFPIILDLVSEGHGYTVLPGAAAHSLPPWYPVIKAPIEGVRVSWQIAYSKDRPLGLAAQKLKDALIGAARASIVNEKWPNAVLDAA